MKVRFREALSVTGVGRVDRDANTIRDVRVCGPTSANGRRYSAGALRDAVPLYEGARVCFDHPEGDSNVRKFRERAGRLVNVRPADDGGLTADLKYNPKHPDIEPFLWYAEHDPQGIGLSHNAEGRGIREASGDVLVEQITKVHSVDIVDNPATNLSLYEQDTSMEPLTDPAAPPAPDADAGAGDVNAKLSALASDFAAHPEWDKATKIAKLKALINLMDDAASDDAQSEPDGDEGAEMPEDEMMEQLGAFRSRAVKKARGILMRESRRKLATAKGLSPELVTDVFLEQLAEVPEPKALRLIEDRRQVGTAAKAAKPKSAAPAAPTDDDNDPAKLAAKLF